MQLHVTHFQASFPSVDSNDDRLAQHVYLLLGIYRLFRLPVTGNAEMVIFAASLMVPQGQVKKMKLKHNCWWGKGFGVRTQISKHDPPQPASHWPALIGKWRGQ